MMFRSPTVLKSIDLQRGHNVEKRPAAAKFMTLDADHPKDGLLPALL